MNTSTQTLEYDVVIIGAGFAGVCQARHLLLKIPNIRVAIVDSRPEEPKRTDHRLGESTVEIAAMFLFRELGLQEYMIENHTPKSGLNFHWPKNPNKTESMSDYYTTWVNRQLHLPSFHINRAKFDRDVLEMNKQMGATYYNGRVLDVELAPKDAIKTVKVKTSGEYLELKAKHIIDAAGRKFIIGRKTDNLIFDKKELYGIDTGSAWVWVRNVDRKIFDNGLHGNETLASRYYATNHWMGTGHWLWMIPLDKDTMDLSVGVVHHNDAISASQVNTEEKFYAFLKANHNVLYQLLKSGEHLEFHYLPRLAHRSKTILSDDNWYVIGDAACIFDALYSLGSTMIAMAVESVTEVISAKLAGESDAEEKRVAYNNFNLLFQRNVNLLVSNHPKQLGNASVMSWRVYSDPMWWFGVLVPMYIGKWHLDLKFISMATGVVEENMNFFLDVYKQLNELAEKGANIGFMDQLRADQLIGHYYTGKLFDKHFLENAKLEPRRTNVFTGIKATAFYTAAWYTKLQWKAFGLKGLLAPRSLYHIFRFLILSRKLAIADLIFRFQTRNLPYNSRIAKLRQEFKSYQYQPELPNWHEEVKAEVDKRVIEMVK
ncbi:tryptophan 7-halogenase [Nostocales cyanobacterium LEGE 12452]|nr:tryptophan 7-halogenase [Nostocales cyanobacterium LEGE 12452]